MNARIPVKRQPKKKSYALKQNVSNNRPYNLIPNGDIEENVVNDQNKIENLVLNNKALMQALKVSYRTISHQDKVISSLEKKLISQIPEILKTKLKTIGNALRQVVEIVDETTNLLCSNTVTSIITEEETKNLSSSLSLITNDIAANVNKILNKKKKHKINKKKAAPKVNPTFNFNLPELEDLLENNSLLDFPFEPYSHEMSPFAETQMRINPQNRPNNGIQAKTNTFKQVKKNKPTKKATIKKSNLNKPSTVVNMKSKAKVVKSNNTKNNLKTKGLSPQAKLALLEAQDPRLSISNTRRKSVKFADIPTTSYSDSQEMLSFDVKPHLLPPPKFSILRNSLMAEKPPAKRTNTARSILKGNLRNKTEKSDANKSNAKLLPSRKARLPFGYNLMASSDSENDNESLMDLSYMLKNIKKEKIENPPDNNNNSIEGILSPSLIDLTIQPKVLLKDIFALPLKENKCPIEKNKPDNNCKEVNEEYSIIKTVADFHAANEPEEILPLPLNEAELNNIDSLLPTKSESEKDSIEKKVETLTSGNLTVVESIDIENHTEVEEAMLIS